MMDAGSIHDTEVNESLNAVAACEAWPIVRIVVGYELARLHRSRLLLELLLCFPLPTLLQNSGQLPHPLSCS
jgi:hypothetical protein